MGLFRIAVVGISVFLIRLFVDWRQPKCHPKYGVKDRTIIVTGANSGIGYETAKYLYKEGAIVILACRSEIRAQEAIKKMERECKADKNLGKLIFMKLELNSFESIHEFVDEIKEEKLKIFSLINNAGVFNQTFKMNEEGLEQQFMINHLGQQLLSELLLPNLVENGTKLSPSKIIYVNSILYEKGKIQDIFFKPFGLTENQFRKTNMYVNSKLASLLYARKLAEQVKRLEYPLYVNIASPGFTYTNLGRNEKYRFFKMFSTLPLLLFFLRTPKQASQTILECCLANNLNSNGKFFRKCKESDLKSIAKDWNLIDKVYSLTRETIGLKIK